MARRKHTYTRELAPTNQGSVRRPARLDLRETCEVHARTHKLFADLREVLNLPQGLCYADIYERYSLVALEHCVWHLRNSPKAARDFIRSLFQPLDKADYLRSQYARLRKRFEPNKAKDTQS